MATGNSGQGMTHGVVASLLIPALIMDGGSPWEELYDPSRKAPSAIKNFITENVTAVKNFVEYVAPGELKSVDELKPGQGAIVPRVSPKSPPTGTSKARSNAARRPAHIWAVTCTGILGTLLGLPLPRFAFRGGRHRAERPRRRTACTPHR